MSESGKRSGRSDKPPARRVKSEPGRRMVAVLDEDPDLARQLSPRALAVARTVALAPLLELQPSPAPFLIDEDQTHGHLGLLVLDGLISQRVSFGQLGSTEFIGPGDALRPWVLPEQAELSAARWEILTPTRIAELDREFAQRIRTWPELAAGLLDRSTRRVHSQLVQSAIRQAKRVEDRVLLALWHFAGRWGEATDAGRTVNLPVTGEVLAQIVGARRQSVSSALGALQSRGLLRRLPDNSWLLPHEPPELQTVEIGRRASDQYPQAL